MTARLVAIDEGPDILLDRAMVVVGRHPGCDARLDSLRVSRHHCCMVQESGEVVVRDLGSTNGIRINGQRVEMGRLKPGDELSIAHIRYRLDNSQGHDRTVADQAGASPFSSGPLPGSLSRAGSHEEDRYPSNHPPLSPPPADENALAAAVRKILPSAVAEKCRIQVIVQMSNDKDGNGGAQVPASGRRSPESHAE